MVSPDSRQHSSSVRDANALRVFAPAQARYFDPPDPRKARVIELRFFAGLSVEETAEVLKVSSDTVNRDWRLARAWLLAELGDPQNEKR